MLLLSFPLACLTQTWEFALIQVGKKLRKFWHEAPPFCDLLITNTSALWRSSLNTAASLEKSISREKFTHAAPCAEAKEAAYKDESEEKAGALRKTYTLFLLDIPRPNGEIDEAYTLHTPAMGSGLPCQFCGWGSREVLSLGAAQWQRCYGNLNTVVEIGLNSVACSLWDAMLSCCYGLAAVPLSGLTATWGFFRYCGAFQMAAKCMSLRLQDESLLRSLCIALSLEAVQCSPHQVFQSY